MISQRNEKADVSFALGSIQVSKAAKQIVTTLGLSEANTELYGRAMDLDAAMAEISAGNRQAFNIESQGTTIHLSTAKAYQQHLIDIRRKNGSESSTVECLNELATWPGFIQACVSDAEYSFWQNAADPLQYEAAGRGYAGLRMVSNGLPAPLEQMVVDTSENPGRRILRVGYIEMVGHEIWLGQPFWDVVGESKRARFLNTTDFRVFELENGVTRISVPEGPFIDTSSKDKQDHLRRLLFG